MNFTIDTKKVVKIVYTNHRGETDIREIIPIEIVYASTEFHPEAQWLIKAFALDRQAERHFSLREIKAWF